MKDATLKAGTYGTSSGQGGARQGQDWFGGAGLGPVWNGLAVPGVAWQGMARVMPLGNTRGITFLQGRL